MLFNSVAFLVFFPIVTWLYFASSRRQRTIVLLVASCVFYMFFVPVYLLILVFTIVVDYFAGILIEGLQGRRRRMALGLSIAANVLVLAIFKYYGFIADNVNTLAAVTRTGFAIPPLSILLPIGLSFHTFQAMSYTIEVYRGKVPAERNFLTYSLYVLFYPQLVAGPIERPQNLLPQFHTLHRFDYGNFVAGLQRMAIGMFKKVVIADTLARQVDLVYNDPTAYTGLPLIVATVFFSFQVYYDFSGYSDIALGCAQVMGFKLMENFKTPYFATSIADFWRRWHISLSSWFRDYLYFPLGGNRGSTAQNYRNVMIVFLVSGLWHGAAWTYVLFGGVHGAYIVIGNATSELRGRIDRRLATWMPAGLRTSLRVLTVFLLVTLAFVIFRAESMADARYIYSNLTVGLGDHFRTLSQGSPLPGIDRKALLAGIVLLFPAIFIEYQTIERREVRESVLLSRTPVILRYAAYLVLIYGSLLVGASQGDQQFIYFQF